MAMNCKPISTIDERINDIRMRTAEIVNNDILPNESRLWAERREGESFHDRAAVLQLRAGIKEKVKKAGLWAPHLPTEYGGMGLDFLAHAYMNEVFGLRDRRVVIVRCGCTELGQPVDSREIRNAGAEGEVAHAAHRRDDGVRVLDDRTTQSGL